MVRPGKAKERADAVVTADDDGRKLEAASARKRARPSTTASASRPTAAELQEAVDVVEQPRPPARSEDGPDVLTESANGAPLLFSLY